VGMHKVAESHAGVMVLENSSAVSLLAAAAAALGIEH
jgi:hypothetical protein